MVKKRLLRIIGGAIGCALCLGFAGCTMFRDPGDIEEKMRMIEEKKQNYAALREALVTKTIPQGYSTQKIKDIFGSPDDVYRSSSSSSQFEIWTYEKVLTPGEAESDSWEQIRLYFNNDRLVSWKY